MSEKVQRPPYNAIEFLRKDLDNHAIEVIIDENVGPQRLYLLHATIELSSLLKDFLDAYGDEFKLVAESLIGVGLQVNSYGVIYDYDLKVVFAFNQKLAYYDEQSHRVVYKHPQQVMLEAMEANPNRPKRKPIIPTQLPPQSGGGFGRRQRIVFRYAIVDPQK